MQAEHEHLVLGTMFLKKFMALAAKAKVNVYKCRSLYPLLTVTNGLQTSNI